jgi:hypothetical protein
MVGLWILKPIGILETETWTNTDGSSATQVTHPLTPSGDARSPTPDVASNCPRRLSWVATIHSSRRFTHGLKVKSL